jgi:hypothetical protein
MTTTTIPTPKPGETKAFTELATFLAAIREPFDQIWLKWWDWHLQHPVVERQLRGLALTAKSKGMARYGIGAIWEVLRWHLRIDGGKVEEFKCANAYRSRYARYLMWKYSELKDFFVLRELRSNGEMGDCDETGR